MPIFFMSPILLFPRGDLCRGPRGAAVQGRTVATAGENDAFGRKAQKASLSIAQKLVFSILL